MRGYTAHYERTEQDARKLLEEEAERIRASGATVARSHLRMSRPDVEILAVAEEIGAGMVVVGSRGLGCVKRALMGGISDSVVCITRTARCSSCGRKWSSVTLRCISPVRTDN